MRSEYHDSLENPKDEKKKNKQKRIKKDTQRCNGHKSIPTTVAHHTHQHTFHHEFYVVKEQERKRKRRNHRVKDIDKRHSDQKASSSKP
jgi:hypothetical protein